VRILRLLEGLREDILARVGLLGGLFHSIICFCLMFVFFVWIFIFIF
jgi:hypothetical protein